MSVGRIENQLPLMAREPKSNHSSEALQLCLMSACLSLINHISYHIITMTRPLLEVSLLDQAPVTAPGPMPEVPVPRPLTAGPLTTTRRFWGRRGVRQARKDLDYETG